MKRHHPILCVIVFFILLLSSSHAFACVTPAPGPIDFYLVDDPNSEGSGTMVVQASLLDIYPSDDLTALLQYSWDDSAYLDWPGTDLVVDSIDKFKRIFFRLRLFSDGTETGYDTDGIITWPVAPEGEYYGLDAYSHAMIDWGDFQFQILSSNSNDNFASTPIPSGLLLLITGLIGLIGSRSRWYAFKNNRDS
ncbi:MAG: hypothetical protein PVH87_18425 [Desulfobacteraceae bacterium]|jgi:hypothetical protein